MTEDDFPQILPVEKKSYLQPWTETNFLAEFHKPYSTQWVLTDDETDQLVLGYVVFWTMEKSIEILNITAHPDWRRQGVARKMLRQVANHGLKTSCESLILDVRKNNIAALHLYQGLGFTIQQIRKAFYPDGTDAYHMVLPLVGERVEF